MRQPLIVGVGGTLRAGSTSERALKVALGVAVEMGCATKLFSGAGINFPPYDPAERQRSGEARALVITSANAARTILVLLPTNQRLARLSAYEPSTTHSSPIEHKMRAAHTNLTHGMAAWRKRADQQTTSGPKHG